MPFPAEADPSAFRGAGRFAVALGRAAAAAPRAGAPSFVVAVRFAAAVPFVAVVFAGGDFAADAFAAAVLPDGDLCFAAEDFAVGGFAAAGWAADVSALEDSAAAVFAGVFFVAAGVLAADDFAAEVLAAVLPVLPAEVVPPVVFVPLGLAALVFTVPLFVDAAPVDRAVPPREVDFFVSAGGTTGCSLPDAEACAAGFSADTGDAARDVRPDAVLAGRAVFFTGLSAPASPPSAAIAGAGSWTSEADRGRPESVPFAPPPAGVLPAAAGRRGERGFFTGAEAGASGSPEAFS